MEIENPKVIIIEPKTGLAHELPGVAKISMPHVDLGDFKPKQNPETGLFSWHAKATVKISRRTRKQIDYLLRPKREPKYVDKATYVSWILRYDVTNIKTESELRKMTHRELEKMVVLIVPQILSGEYERISRMYEQKHDYPCGGIVPKTQFKLDVNTGDAVIKLDDAKKMLEQLKQ